MYRYRGLSPYLLTGDCPHCGSSSYRFLENDSTMATITITMAKELCPYHAEKSVVRKHETKESSTKMATTSAKNPNRKMMKTKREKKKELTLLLSFTTTMTGKIMLLFPRNQAK